MIDGEVYVPTTCLHLTGEVGFDRRSKLGGGEKTNCNIISPSVINSPYLSAAILENSNV